MVDYPVVVLFVPNGHFFVLFVLLWWNEVVNNVLFELQLIGKFVDGIKHIISLSVKVLLAAIQRVLHLTIFTPEPFKPPGLVLQLLLYTAKLLLSEHELLLLKFQFLIELFLLLVFFFERFSCFP